MRWGEEGEWRGKEGRGREGEKGIRRERSGGRGKVGIGLAPLAKLPVGAYVLKDCVKMMNMHNVMRADVYRTLMFGTRKTWTRYSFVSRNFSKSLTLS